MSTKLTPTQSRALAFIQESIERSGIAPSLRELCVHMGYSAVGSAQDLINALRKKGYLENPEKQAARSLVPTSLTQRLSVNEYDPNTYLIPCLGSVPAGNPVEAVEEHIAQLRLSMAMVPPPRPRADELFALRASGESMIQAGIMDGDWMVVQLRKDCNVGDITVARLDNGEATVKRLLKDRARGWYLQPENSRFEPIYGDEQPFEILGRVIALQRVLV